MRKLAIFVVLCCACMFSGSAQAQDANPNSVTASCTFDDGSQVSVQYNNSGAKTEEPHNAKPWRPGGAPMLLFTQTALTVNKTEIAPGAYSLWIIPEKKGWTLAINKNVKPESQYDQGQDLVRVSMDLGQLSTPLKQPEVGFAHVAPKECNMRVYYGKTGAWAEFDEK